MKIVALRDNHPLWIKGQIFGGKAGDVKVNLGLESFVTMDGLVALGLFAEVKEPESLEDLIEDYLHLTENPTGKYIAELVQDKAVEVVKDQFEELRLNDSCSLKKIIEALKKM